MNTRYPACLRKLTAIVLLLPAFNLQASGLSVDVASVESSVMIAEQEFKPRLTRLGLGWQFTERFSIGLSQATSAGDDSVSSVTADVKSISTVLLRYGTPVNSDVNVYAMLGYSELNLLMQGNTVQTDEAYADMTWGLGFEERIMKKSGLRLYFDYLTHYDQHELIVSSMQLGLRYVFD